MSTAPNNIKILNHRCRRLFMSQSIPSLVSAPRYRMLPTETDLNMSPLVPDLPEKVLPVDYPSVQCRTSSGGFSCHR